MRIKSRIIKIEQQNIQESKYYRNNFDKEMIKFCLESEELKEDINTLVYILKYRNDVFMDLNEFMDIFNDDDIYYGYDSYINKFKDYLFKKNPNLVVDKDKMQSVINCNDYEKFSELRDIYCLIRYYLSERKKGVKNFSSFIEDKI